MRNAYSVIKRIRNTEYGIGDMRKTMFEIKMAKEMGMCFGVRDTLAMIDEASKSRERIDTLGTLVHNPQLVERLNTKGIQVVDALQGVSAPTMAVTAHGAAPEIYKQARDAGFELIDTTCPLVTRVQQLAKTLMEQGHPRLG
jgi:4-hydroxy-3-methylbut-2-enyl diphosphate reductase IspH